MDLGVDRPGHAVPAVGGRAVAVQLCEVPVGPAGKRQPGDRWLERRPDRLDEAGRRGPSGRCPLGQDDDPGDRQPGQRHAQLAQTVAPGIVEEQGDLEAGRDGRGAGRRHGQRACPVRRPEVEVDSQVIEAQVGQSRRFATTERRRALRDPEADRRPCPPREPADLQPFDPTGPSRAVRGRPRRRQAHALGERPAAGSRVRVVGTGDAARLERGVGPVALVLGREQAALEGRPDGDPVEVDLERRAGRDEGELPAVHDLLRRDEPGQDAGDGTVRRLGPVRPAGRRCLGVEDAEADPAELEVGARHALHRVVDPPIGGGRDRPLPPEVDVAGPVAGAERDLQVAVAAGDAQPGHDRQDRVPVAIPDRHVDAVHELRVAPPDAREVHPVEVEGELARPAGHGPAGRASVVRTRARMGRATGARAQPLPVPTVSPQPSSCRPQPAATDALSRSTSWTHGGGAGTGLRVISRPARRVRTLRNWRSAWRLRPWMS